MDEKTIAEIRAAAGILREVGFPVMSDRLLALIPRQETLEEVMEEFVECRLAPGEPMPPRLYERLRAALERRKAGK